jgi:hypothetical protein
MMTLASQLPDPSSDPPADEEASSVVTQSANSSTASRISRLRGSAGSSNHPMRQSMPSFGSVTAHGGGGALAGTSSVTTPRSTATTPRSTAGGDGGRGHVTMTPRSAGPTTASRMRSAAAAGVSGPASVRNARLSTTWGTDGVSPTRGQARKTSRGRSCDQGGGTQSTISSALAGGGPTPRVSWGSGGHADAGAGASRGRTDPPPAGSPEPLGPVHEERSWFDTDGGASGVMGKESAAREAAAAMEVAASAAANAAVMQKQVWLTAWRPPCCVLSLLHMLHSFVGEPINSPPSPLVR